MFIQKLTCFNITYKFCCKVLQTGGNLKLTCRGYDLASSEDPGAEREIARMVKEQTGFVALDFDTEMKAREGPKPGLARSRGSISKFGKIYQNAFEM